MKKILYTAFVVTAALALGSCHVTDVTPQERISDATFWQTPNDLELYCNSFYENMFAKPHPGLDRGTDNQFYKEPDRWLMNQENIPTGAGGGEWDWNNLRNINYFLTRYQKVSGAPADINQYVGEMRFFRALEYFNKIKRYGDVPWYDKDLNTDNTEELFKARDSRSFITGKIIEDLEWAGANMKLKSEVTPGRLHSMAAYQLLARVCLHEATYAKYHGTPGADANALFEKAAATAKLIMDKGGFAIVKQDMAKDYQWVIKDPSWKNVKGVNYDGATLHTYYYSLFNQVDLNSHRESVLHRIYINNILMHNTPRVLAEWSLGMSKDLADTYLCADGLPIAISPLYAGDDSISLEVLNRDGRMRQTFLNKTIMSNYDKGKIGATAYSSVNPNTVPGGYSNIKYGHPDQIYHEPAGCELDFMIMRYAEVLLVYAEAKAELGQCDQGVLDATINVLRDRAEMAPLSVAVGFDDPTQDYGYPISPLLREIRRERRVELAIDGFRYDDIMRWKAAKTLLSNPKVILGIPVNDFVAKQYAPNTFGPGAVNLIKIKSIRGNDIEVIRPYPGLTNYSWNDRSYLHPIPQDQLRINTKLVQNKGWE
ncbi:MAG: RagB/SusD family nutrient uptake outer membrane protein [Mucinivorans sp.]